MKFRDDRLPALAVVLDPDLFSSTFDEALRVDNLRYKPGVSLVARATGHGQTRWVVSYASGHTAKLDKLLRHADADGTTLCAKTVPGSPGHTIVMGPITSDYKLRKPLRALAASDAFSAPGSRFLNYNPHRRLVVSLQHHGQPLVAKISASSAPVPRHLLDALAAADVPVLQQTQPEGLPANRHVSYYPWHGKHNLKDSLRAGTAGTESICRAGVALAALHAQSLTASPGTYPPSTTASRAPHKLTRMAEDVSDLLPHLSTELQLMAGRIVNVLPSKEPQVLLHGDFSSDQILGNFCADQTTDVDLRLIDLDRWGLGPATSDLGSFAAAELTDPSGLPHTDVMESLLNGYGHVDVSALNAWTAFHLYCRLTEPFRSCSPQWQEQIRLRLHHIGEFLR